MKNIKRAAAWLLCAAMLFSTQELQILAAASPSQVVLEDPEDLVRDASSSNAAAAEDTGRENEETPQEGGASDAQAE